MSERAVAVVLAAGEGTRMKSAVPKVLHKVAGRSMLGHVLDAAAQAGIGRAAVVVGPDRADVEAEARTAAPGAAVFVQAERLGTAHAVLAAREAFGGDDVVVLYGDTPLLSPPTLRRLTDALAEGAAVVVLGFEPAEPTGYGRLIVEGGELVRIVEEKDASPAERSIRLCNGGLMALAGAHARALLEAIGNANAKGEFYLTDAVEIARGRGLTAVAETVAEEEVMGVNDRLQLAAAEAVLQRRLRERAMREGATLVAPETVFLSHDTRIGRDVLIEPWCWFGPGVTVADGAVVHGFSHLEGAHVGPAASVGPYGRLRPGTRLGRKAKVGNFVEVKAADVEEGAKINHLTYIGDARVGANANIGAGTITCNYDGFFKQHTDIGADAFVGSNSALVAPVKIGDGANIGAGSVITKDVEPGALAVARGRQVEIAGWARTFRARRAAEKAGKAKD
ncbi:bifunctional UDP-N-acetylglucosamine diphosphorylase/glucosamine-1-phosphate N-acetyltransferase GlmU [Labrys wisconsinensis]|uniref:Bifunctional protein GlmU n=1 Tax=Labrys wisconsinensis TaxID=425677 RepID=A0ABU0J394_9HYPH|nr:bifunctional UDP-N-acetylglucosamine diphosphorylase/glucosamine-1-phosphate N-acetyltransferase GlmU [Labrys wisconsinensis]MDQ0468741.1 bifunctional UDP-N-acetylglucosamine pyrophosphorylase/glucosamine-1-phosphate N-acetyltransferase [Labrys wisconsinensis]